MTTRAHILHLSQRVALLVIERRCGRVEYYALRRT